MASTGAPRGGTSPRPPPHRAPAARDAPRSRPRRRRGVDASRRPPAARLLRAAQTGTDTRLRPRRRPPSRRGSAGIGFGSPCMTRAMPSRWSPATWPRVGARGPAPAAGVLVLVVGGAVARPRQIAMRQLFHFFRVIGPSSRRPPPSAGFSPPARPHARTRGTSWRSSARSCRCAERRA
jgi:hypothetical protein